MPNHSEQQPAHKKNSVLENLGAFEPIFVARQPIFDLKQEIWGYELLFRHAQGAQTATINDPNAATARVIADGFALGSEGVAPDQKLLINFPAALLLTDSALALPKQTCIPEILETVRPEPPILKACSALKQEGYTLALDDYVGDPGYEELLALADIVKVDVLDMPIPKIIAIGQQFKKTGATLLAEKVETKEIFQVCKASGFSLFQGYYFSKPEIIPGRTLSTGQIAKLQLMGQLAQDNYDVATVATTITQDPSLSFRLLRHMNSAAFQLQRKVDSIKQAVALLGGRPLRQWLLVATLSDMGSEPKTSELFFSSVLRGRFLSTSHPAMTNAPLDADAFFLLGVFSQLDALLDQPMPEILPLLNLSETLEQALTHGNGPAARPLALAIALDKGDFGAASKELLFLGLNPATAATLHTQASLWAKALMESHGSAPSNPAKTAS